MKIVHKHGYTQDGYIGRNSGRIVIYNGEMLVSRNPSSDHNYLLRGLAARFGFKKDDVISNAIRLYFTRDGNTYYINGVRKLDDDAFERKFSFYKKALSKRLK